MHLLATNRPRLTVCCIVTCRLRSAGLRVRECQVRSGICLHAVIGAPSAPTKSTSAGGAKVPSEQLGLRLNYVLLSASEI